MSDPSSTTDLLTAQYHEDIIQADWRIFQQVKTMSREFISCLRPAHAKIEATSSPAERTQVVAYLETVLLPCTHQIFAEKYRNKIGNLICDEMAHLIGNHLLRSCHPEIINLHGAVRQLKAVGMQLLRQKYSKMRRSLRLQMRQQKLQLQKERLQKDIGTLQRELQEQGKSTRWEEYPDILAVVKRELCEILALVMQNATTFIIQECEKIRLNLR